MNPEEDSTQLADLTDVPLTDFLETTQNPALKRSIAAVLKSITDSNGAISAFSAFAS